jgi:hypothetical protein
VFDTAVALVTAVVSALVSGSVGWLFAVPFVAVCAYTAWEVRRSDLRAALVAPPLSLLLALVVAGFFDDSSGSASAGLRAGAINVFAHLAQQAPVLVLAEAVVALIVCYRWWRSRQVTP